MTSEGALLILIGLLALAAVGISALVIALAALKTWHMVLQGPPPREVDLSEIYEPLHIEIPDDEEGPRESRYTMSEHEIVAGLTVGLDYDQFIARERELERRRGIVHERQSTG